MNRKHVHLVFAAAAAAFALLAVGKVMELMRAERVNAAVASTSTVDSSMPEALFARAKALSAAGDYEAALQTYKKLMRSDRADIRRPVLYNLGNLHLRQALKNGPSGAPESLPLIELAKQAYRDLLRDDPGDWDARYNLERALRLAPEVADEDAEQNRPTQFQRLLIRIAPEFKQELP
jgi:mxaK protein